MFDLGWSEILVIAVVAILVVGPNDLPRMMRTIGEWVGKMRRMAQHFQAGVDEMIRQSELEDLRKDLKTIHREVNAPLAPGRITAPPAREMIRTEATPAAAEAQPLPDTPPQAP